MEVFGKEGFSLRKIIFHYREYTEKKIASFVEEKGFDKMEFQDHNYFMDYLIDLSDKWFKFK